MTGRPMIENSDRGITLNKSLAWTMATGLLLAGLWLGVQMTELKSAVEDLGTRQAEDRLEIRANAAMITEIRRTEVRLDQRLINIEENVNEVLRYVRAANGDTR